MASQIVRWRIMITAIAVIILLAIIQVFGGLAFVERTLGAVIEPAAGFTYGIVERISPVYRSTDDQLLQQNEQLKNEVATLSQRSSNLEQQLQQYSELSNQLAFAQQHSIVTQPATIISRVGSNEAAKLVTINIGSQQGVVVGQPVLYVNGGLFGVAYNVHDSTTEVALLTSGLVSVQAKTQNEANTKGLITGDFGVSLLMNFILKDAVINPNDVIVTSGDDPLIPAGLVIGTVQSIANENSELFKTGTVLPHVRYAPNSVVSVITGVQ